MQPLDLYQLTTLIEAAPSHLAALVVAGAGSGLRPGELLGLEVGAVDFLRREVHVHRQLVTLDGAPGVPRATQDADVSPVRTAVRRRARRPGRAPRPPSRRTGRTPGHLGRREVTREVSLVFTNRAGSPWRRQRFSDAFRRAADKAGLPPTTRAHDLRHTFAATLISGGASPKVVQRLLGHKTISETLDTYGHLMAGDLDRARDAVQLAFTAPASADRAAGVR